MPATADGRPRDPGGASEEMAGVAFVLASLGVLIYSTFNLPVITRYLWPVVVIPMIVYPYTKRWTWTCHLILGLVDGLAPVGAWVAVTGTISWRPVVLGAGVALWIAGFDIIYAFMDVAVDREQGCIRSRPILGKPWRCGAPGAAMCWR